MIETIYIKPGERGRARMPYSEVCMHMRIAGKVMQFEMLTERSVQLYDDDGSKFSAPILTGEAGIYSQNGKHFYHPNLEADNE